jgi:hydroxymethylbilane synthase
MLPAPAQGAIMVVCREGDEYVFEGCQKFNDEATALCTKIEKDFLRILMGGCSTPISALAELKEDGNVHFKGNVCSPDGKDLVDTAFVFSKEVAVTEGEEAARRLLSHPTAQYIIQTVRNGKG